MPRAVTLWILIVIVAAPLCARAENWYVHAQSGNDANSGSAASPFRTLARLASVVRSGDVCRIAGTFRAQSLSLTGISYCTIEQWEGQAQAIVRADEQVAGFIPSDGVHVASIPGAPLYLATVIVDWDAALGGDGRRRAHLRPVHESLVSKLDYSYSYDSLSGAISLRLDGADPAGHSIAYVAPGGNAFWFRPGGGEACVGNTVRGITFALWADGAAGRGNGVLMENARGALIENCRFEDCGYHAWSFPSGICEDNIVRDCFAAGLAAGGIGGAFYAGGAGVSGARVSASAVRCRVLANGFLDPRGMPVFPGATSGGFISHTDGVNNNLVADVEYIECTVEGYVPPSGAGGRDNAFYSRDALVAADRFDPATYAVRAERCKLVDASASLSPGSIAFSRSRLELTRAGASGASAGGVLGDAGGAAPGTSHGFFACEIVVDLDAPIAGTGMVFNCRGNAQTVLVNTSVYDRGVGGAGASPAWRFMFNYGGSGSAAAVGSVFAYRVTGTGNATRFLCANDLANGVDAHAFAQCAIRGVTDGFYSGNPAFNQSAEWSTIVDPGAAIVESNPFIDQAGATLDLSEPLRSVQRPTSPRAPYGFNGRAYDGRFGAWQYGTCAADMDADGFVTGQDFDSFVELFQTGSPAADFNSDGFVTGVDFDAFVQVFEAGCP